MKRIEPLIPIFYIDFYKVGHVSQYPKGTKYIWSNWTARYTHRVNSHHVTAFGLTYFIKRYLIQEFNENFFGKPWPQIEAQYREVISATLGVANPKTDHLEWLWRYGKLPLAIYGVPEGTDVPYNFPMMVLTNTQPEAFWLVNYIETLMSNVMWIASTSATTAKRYRKIFMDASRSFGNKDFGFVDWQGHDFSFRGMSGIESACLSGMGHLLSFSGTDTVPAILTARDYYGAPLTVGGSVPATEHSVMCAGSKEGELETFRRLITEVYPEGTVSIVSDTWDLWKVLHEYVPQLRNEILSRKRGKVVIRPDSGDPVEISLKSLSILREVMGVDDNGLINGMALIYGDAITEDRAKKIVKGAIDLNLNPYNEVFGIGSYTYQMKTRDTDGLAMKATCVDLGNGPEAIFKDPVTDSAGKKSHRGIPVVFTDDNGEWQIQETLDPRMLDQCSFKKFFEDGQLLFEESFDEIRKRARQ